MPPSSPRPCFRSATSPTASCRTRRSTWWTKPPRACAWKSIRCRRKSTRSSGASCSSKSSARRCARKPTRIRASGSAQIEKELGTLREQSNGLKAHWQTEKDAIGRIRKQKEEIERLKAEEQRYERAGDLSRVAEIRYGKLSAAEKELKSRAGPACRTAKRSSDAEGRGRRGRDRQDRQQVDGHSRRAGCSKAKCRSSSTWRSGCASAWSGRMRRSRAWPTRFAAAARA